MVDFAVIIVALLVLGILGAIIWERYRNRYVSPEKNPADLYAIAEELDKESKQAAHPLDLFQYPAFMRGVKYLNRAGYSTNDLLAYYTGDNFNISVLALEALAKRSDDTEILKPILAGLNNVSYWTRYFALRTLNARFEEPIVGAVLVSLDSSWLENVPIQILKEFVSDRLAIGEKPAFRDRLNHVSDERAVILEKILVELGENLTAGLLAELQKWRLTRVDINFLKSFGRLWEVSAEAEAELVVKHDQLSHHVSALEATLLHEPLRSAILVGESGVGKTAVLHVLANRIREQSWIVFEAGGVDLLAGQVYIGELEERLQRLIRNIGGKRKVLWIIPDFHDLLWAGRHQYRPTGVLDFILPYLERGEITLIGETQPGSYERLIQSMPKLRSIVETYRIHPLNLNEALQVAREWAQQCNLNNTSPLISEETLQEAAQLTQQYLGDKALPGNLLQFLQFTLIRLAAGDFSGPLQITLDDLILTLSQLTGLPVNILDDRQGLDLQALRDFFEKRVLGQREVINCLVERVAMIKAGLTDPTRPQGVFLFVGPTGTGKTEIAKTLAEFLFGSPERLIRLDMSEFQTLDSLDRLTGAQYQNGTDFTFVNQIREQPFSVVLLDEFEKAHSNIWDLFLQVFDDGRLTDSRGYTADFRHCIIILTSNLGANIPFGSSIGFSKNGSGFTPGSVERAVNQVFRKEFINRIDRVVVFRPLDRGVMRDLLYKELNEVLSRRGLRSRNWAVEWDDTAINFLLDKGFTSDLGARPLKRAIERYLLSPLAMTIVNHQFPEGDQFLFVRSDGHKIEVEFIDPDAPDIEAEETDDLTAKEIQNLEQQLRIEKIVLDAHGTLAELEFLRGHYERLFALVEDNSWRQEKQAALAQTSSPGFWNSPERFTVLGHAEYMDRIETGLSTAGSLLNRLRGSHPGARKHFSKELLQRLAQQIYLIDAACTDLADDRPRDAFVLVEAGRDSGVAGSLNDEFAMRLGRMYRQWGAKRRMRFEVLEERGGDGPDAYRLLLSVIGFAAFSILKPEGGLHVLEIPSGGKSFLRCKVRVRVAPQPDEPPGHDPEAFRAQALRVFAEFDDGKLAIVRRYREQPSPLVRDSVRQWRSGNWTRVLDGDFDLIC